MAEWSTAYRNSLPNAAFACVRGNERFYPHHDKSGKLDLPHLRAAMSRIGDASNEQCGKAHLMAHAKAAGMGMMKAEFLKAEPIAGSAKWRVLAIPFGGPLKGGKDLDGEFFDAETDIKARWFRERPVIFHHGQDAMLKDADLGTQELDDEPTSEGWWSTVWLDRSKRYWEQVEALLRSGKMYGSSGAIGYLVRKDPLTGHIEVWPHAEQTLTPTPSNPYARITATKALAGFDAVGIAVDDPIKSILAELDRLADEPSPDLPESGEPDLDEGGEEPAEQQTDVPASLKTTDPWLRGRIALAETRLGLVRRRL